MIVNKLHDDAIKRKEVRNDCNIGVFNVSFIDNIVVKCNTFDV